MRMCFWHGYDDPMVVEWATADAPPILDALYNRPFNFIASYIALFLSHNSINGFMVLAVSFRFLGGVFLYGILRCLAPRGIVPVLAAILYIVNPCEPLRYMMLAMSGYFFTLCLLLFSFLLLFRSYATGNRWMLSLSCVSLGVTLLAANEGGYPLAAFMTFLLPVCGGKRSHLLLWVYAWVGTISLLAMRFLIYLKFHAEPYQLRAGGGTPPHSVQAFLINLWHRIEPIFNYFSSQGAATYWGYGLSLVAIAAIVVVLALIARKRNEKEVSGQQALVGLSITATCILLGVLPFVHFAYPERTQFYAAPAQASFLAFLIVFLAGLLGKCLPRSVSFQVAAASKLLLVSSIVFLAGTSSMHYQDNFNPLVRFPKIIRILDQVRAIGAPFPEDSAILFVLDEKNASPVGANYSIQMLTSHHFGVVSAQANYKDPVEETKITKDGVIILPHVRLAARRDNLLVGMASNETVLKKPINTIKLWLSLFLQPVM